MKLKYLFLSVAAVTLLLSGCKKEEKLGPEEVTLSGSSAIELPTAGDEVTLSLKATVDWTLQGYDSDVQSWLVINPSSGKASNDTQTITVKALENKDIDRTASIVFYGNILCKAPLTITQKGPNGDGSSLNIADFIKKADSSKAYTLTGKLLNYKASTSNGTTYYSFDLTDDSGSILVYSFTNIEEWVNNLEIGGTVKLTGTYEYYSSKSQHEVVDATIESYTAPDYSTVKETTVTEFLNQKDTKNIYKLTGTVKSFNSTYCSFNLTDGSSSVYVYGLSPASREAYASKLSNGVKVTLYGGYYYYENTSDSSKSKVEILGATIIKVEEGSTGGDESDYKNAKSVTVADFIKAADTATYYKLSGTVSSFNSTYCSFDLTDDSGSIYVFSVANKSDWTDKISNGGKVTLAGKYYYYSDKSKHEVVDAYILSFEAGGESGGDDEVGKPTNATKVTIAEFLAKEVNTTDWYEITGTITSIAKETYGNFYVKDDTSDNLYVYGLTKEWTDGVNDQSFSQIGLKVGDKVTFWTLRAEYNGTAQAGGSDCPALYISHEAGTETTYPTGSVVLTFPDDNKDNNAANDYTSTWTAKIGSNEFSIENFNNYKWDGWTYIKCGRKKDPSVAKITNTTAVEAKIAKVAVTADSYDATSVNSLVMNVYSDSARSTKVCSVDMTSSAKAGEIEFAVPSANQGKGLYYEIVFDCKSSSAKKNGFVQISKVAYIAAE